MKTFTKEELLESLLRQTRTIENSDKLSDEEKKERTIVTYAFMKQIEDEKLH